MKLTEYLKMKLFEGTDKTDMNVVNENIEAIDSEVKELSNKSNQNSKSIKELEYDSGWQECVPVYNATLDHDIVGQYETNCTEWQVRRIGNICSMRGEISPKEELSTGTIIGTIPKEFVPQKTTRFVMQGSTVNRFMCEVRSDGKIAVGRYSATSNQGFPLFIWMNMFATWFVG